MANGGVGGEMKRVLASFSSCLYESFRQQQEKGRNWDEMSREKLARGSPTGGHGRAAKASGRKATCRLHQAISTNCRKASGPHPSEPPLSQHLDKRKANANVGEAGSTHTCRRSTRHTHPHDLRQQRGRLRLRRQPCRRVAPACARQKVPTTAALDVRGVGNFEGPPRHDRLGPRVSPPRESR